MTESFHVYLTSTQVVVRRKTGFLWRQRVESTGSWSWDARVPASLQFDQLKLQKKRANLYVYVGSSLCKFMALDLPSELSDIDEQRAVAQAQMQHQLGLNSSEWRFTLDVMHSPQKTIVCAIRLNIIKHIQELTNDKVLRLISLKPYVTNVWNTFNERFDKNSTDQQALIAFENDAYTLFMRRSNILESMSAMTHHSEMNLVDRELKRVALSFGQNDQQKIYLALAENLMSIVHGSKANVLQKDDYLKNILYADFRDLLFYSKAIT